MHTLLFKNSHSLLRDLGENINPDYVLVTNKIDLIKFRNKFATNNHMKFKLFGSPKNKIVFSKKKIKQNNTILFLPSGEDQEAFIMTNFAIKFAELYPEIKVIIRYHPINKDKFCNVKDSLNFNISERDIIEDCQISKWAIYSSSSSIFEAIKEGCLPLKMINDCLININDPLWQFKSSIIRSFISHKELFFIINQRNISRQDNKNLISDFEMLLSEINKSRYPCKKEILIDL